MFDETAPKYDLMNDVMSLGRDRSWRREVVRALAIRPGERVLDLAAGTGTSSAPLAAADAATSTETYFFASLIALPDHTPVSTYTALPVRMPRFSGTIAN